ncbi:conserved hypothetical protein [Ricinus communis]|uniref:Uncharacterized protein n=1 Tax=Ricinus communis TaxID=3988 RepID=B9SVH9_RICCO|nr:conserved hypothetical protein [Ricinus communis]
MAIIMQRGPLEFYIEQNINASEKVGETSDHAQPFVAVVQNKEHRTNTFGSIETIEDIIDEGVEGGSKRGSNIEVPVGGFNEEDEILPEFVRHQKFDDIRINVDGLTDDEDEDLQAIGQKARESWYKSKPIKHNEK